MKDQQLKVLRKEDPLGFNPTQSAPETLELLLHRAVEARASDLHLQMRGGVGEVLFRLDGVMTPVATLPEGLAERVLGRIKYLARLKTYQEALPQDGRIDRGDINLAHDVRVATYPTVTGEKAVLRLFGEDRAVLLSELAFPAEAIDQLKRSLRRPAGLILLTGPAGSGKTTTIYACLRELTADGGRHVITVEDPVEQVLPGVMQTEVNEERGLSFARAGRHLLRQDPQVLVIGEIRDGETASLVVRAALTGHLVISTLHAGSCSGVVERLLLMSPDRAAVASALELIVNQRLLRKVCAGCGGNGCDACVGTGYHGRVPVVDWVSVNEETRRGIREGVAGALVPDGGLEAAARRLVEAGVTTGSEMNRHFSI